jgi:hypothetical protein
VVSSNVTDRRLHIPLRQWIPPPHCQRVTRPFYYDPTTDGLYFTRTDCFDYHCRISRRVFSYHSTDQQRTLPPSAYPVTLHDHQNGWIVDSYNSYCPTPLSANPTSFEAFCLLLEDWEAQLLLDIHLSFGPFILISKLETSPFRACSDGPAVTQEGTYGWALSLDDGTRLAHGAGYVDGHDPRSFRAEGQGMLSVVCFIHRLLQWTCTDSVLEGILATDNTGLIARVTSQSKLRYSIPNATFKSDWDIVESIVQIVRASHIHITLEHVRGHQDDTTPTEELDLLVQLNIEADKYAGDFRIRRGEYRPIIPLMPTRSVSLDIDGKTVHRNFKTTIRDAIHGTALLEEMQVRYSWPDGTLELIDWEAHRQSTQAQSHRRTHFVKLCHELYRQVI